MISVQVGPRTDDYVELSFPGITPAITAAVSSWELEVYADWEGQNWDRLISLDARPEETSGGYICDLCEADARVIFPTREAQWRNHLFEPFLEWVNEKLATADVLALCGSPGHATWAKLEMWSDPGDKSVIRIPLRI